MSVTNPLSLFEKIIRDYSMFKSRGDLFREKGALDGALVNYTLASNNLNHALDISEDESLKKYIEEKGLANWCEGVCGRLTDMQTEVLSMIVPIQEELKKRRMYERGGTGEDDEKSCDYDKYKQLNFEKSEDCIFFDDIIGQQNAKDLIKNNFVWPNIFPNLYPKVAKGVLLYGPPGTGKTFLAKAAANELNSKTKYDPNFGVLFFAPQGGDLKGKYVGETEKNIRNFFKCASEAATQCQDDKNKNEKDLSRKGKHRVMSVLFIDEVDAIAGDRTDDESGMMTLSVNALLQAIDGVNSFKNVAIIAATNFPWNLDSAFLRRFDNKILIDLPSSSDIYRLIKMQLNEFTGRINEYANKVSDENDKNTRITKTKTQLKCDPSCPEKIEKEYLFTSEYSEYMKKLTENGLKALSIKLAEKKFSPSDVTNLVKNVIRNVADRSRKNNTFYKVPFNQFIKKEYTINGGNIIETPTRSNKTVYISTMSLSDSTRINLDNLPLCNGETKECKTVLEQPSIKSIKINGGNGGSGVSEYINKSLYPKETYLNDEFVKEFYIDSKIQEKNELRVLFPVDIDVQYADGSSELKKFYIQSRVNTDLIKSGWLSWISFGKLGKSMTNEDKKKKLSAYETLVQNMIALYVPNSETSRNNETIVRCNVKTNINNAIKTSLMKRVLADLSTDNIRKTIDMFELERQLIGTNIEIMEFEGFDRNEVDLTLHRNNEKSDSFVDKEAFFTLDIRDSDFLEVLATTASSIKEEEYKELKKYQEDPTKYVKPVKK